jgi:hypothetical protein
MGCLVERNLDLFSAIQGRQRYGVPMQGCPFGEADFDLGFQESVGVHNVTCLEIPFLGSSVKIHFVGHMVLVAIFTYRYLG